MPNSIAEPPIRSQDRAVRLRIEEIDGVVVGVIVVDEKAVNSKRSVVIEKERQEILFVSNDREQNQAARGCAGVLDHADALDDAAEAELLKQQSSWLGLFERTPALPNGPLAELGRPQFNLGG